MRWTLCASRESAVVPLQLVAASPNLIPIDRKSPGAAFTSGCPGAVQHVTGPAGVASPRGLPTECRNRRRAVRSCPQAAVCGSPWEGAAPLRVPRCGSARTSPIVAESVVPACWRRPPPPVSEQGVSCGRSTTGRAMRQMPGSPGSRPTNWCGGSWQRVSCSAAVSAALFWPRAALSELARLELRAIS